MRFNRVWLIAIALLMGISMSVAPASAWEFKMDGSYVWQYEYRSELGNSQFFGPQDVDLGVLGASTSMNGWLGGQGSPDIMTAGSDASWQFMYMINNMEIRINPALRVRGLYYIGAWEPAELARGITAASWYYNYTMPGVQRSFSPGYWNTLWLTAQLPWGTLALGKRPSIFGTGLSWNGAENRSSESLSLVANYGPLRIGIGFYPSREGNEGYYNRFADKNNRRVYDVGLPTITYRTCSTDIGFIMNYVRRHRGPDRYIRTAAVKANEETRDREDFYGGVYMKYNNGRFFLNSEFNWYDRLDRRRDVNAFPGGAVTEYTQNYRIMTELGVMAGPTKVSLLGAWLSGPDRRAGYTANINQGTLTNAIQTGTVVGASNFRYQSATSSNTGLFRPYSYLMVYAYGLGAYMNSDTVNGYVEDAMTYGARMDYAVAANLNVYGSFFWADRVGNGYGWGYLAPDPNINGTGAVGGAYRGTFAAGVPVTVAPNIPDNNLGWEVDAGFDWKLLEGLLVNCTFAYWQPGQWFNYAAISKANPGWNTPNAGNNWGTIPGRNIDPTFGMELKVVGEF